MARQRRYPRGWGHDRDEAARASRRSIASQQGATARAARQRHERGTAKSNIMATPSKTTTRGAASPSSQTVFGSTSSGLLPKNRLGVRLGLWSVGLMLHGRGLFGSGAAAGSSLSATASSAAASSCAVFLGGGTGGVPGSSLLVAGTSSNASAGKADRRKKVVHIYILQYTLCVEFLIDHRQGVMTNAFDWCVRS